LEPLATDGAEGFFPVAFLVALLEVIFEVFFEGLFVFLVLMK
jgi:hypothetical protein